MNFEISWLWLISTAVKWNNEFWPKKHLKKDAQATENLMFWRNVTEFLRSERCKAVQDVQSFRRFLTDMKAQVMPQVKGTMNFLPGRPRESKSSRLKHWVAQDMRMDSFSKRHRETSSLNHRRRKKRHQSPYSSTLASATAWWGYCNVRHQF